MILRTDAIVLRSMDYGETSRIVTLFTRAKGKVAVLAKGARLPKSRFGATLQPMSYTQVVFYYKPSRGLQTLSESSHVRRFPDLGRAVEKITLGLRMVELVQALMQDEQQNPVVFNLLLGLLERLDETETRAANLWPYFQLKLAAVLGFAPHIDRAAVAALAEEGGVLRLDSGAVDVLGAVPGAALRASRAALRAYAIFARADLDTVMRMRLTDEEHRTVARLVEAYLRYHVEDAYPVRSDRVISQLRDVAPDGL